MPGQSLGVRHLDYALGPVPRGAAVVLLNDPGVDPSPFLLQAARSRLARGEPVVYAVTQRDPARPAAQLAGASTGAARGRAALRVVDGYSRRLGLRVPEAITVEDPADPAAFAAALERAADEHGDAALVVESLSTLLDAAPEAYARGLPRLRSAMGRFPLAVASFTRWPYATDVAQALAPFDAVVRLRGVEERVLFRTYFSVERAAWAPKVDRQPRLYKAVEPGGVAVYVPKVLVTGPHRAGKSSFVHAVSERATSAEAMGTTVALDHGHVSLDGLVADLFGTPGQERFDPLLERLAAQALGAVVVVDASATASFPRAREMMRQTCSQGLPVVVAANKQDHPAALPPEAVQRLLRAPAHVGVVGCVAEDPASCRAVLERLIDQILDRSVAP